MEGFKGFGEKVTHCANYVRTISPCSAPETDLKEPIAAMVNALEKRHFLSIQSVPTENGNAP